MVFSCFSSIGFYSIVSTTNFGCLGVITLISLIYFSISYSKLKILSSIVVSTTLTSSFGFVGNF